MTVEPSVAASSSRLAPSPQLGDGGIAAPAGLDWVTRLPSASAPGFVYLAGACRGVAVGGGGADLATAAARLAGETAEVLAQTADPVPSALPGDPAIDAPWTFDPAPLRVAATDVISGRRLGVPAAAIFLRGQALAERRADAPAASLGLAAGSDLAAARLAGLLELIERDAAAAWWREGVRPRQADAAGIATAADELGRLRAGAAAPRPTGFFVLEAALGVPVVCAMSSDADGRGLAFGLKAAPGVAAAACGALDELMQMELALEMARRRAGRGVRSAGDRGPLARAALAPESFAAFAALPPASQADAPGEFTALAAALARGGHVVVSADLAGPASGLSVVKVIVPGLRPLPGGAFPALAGSPGAAAPLM